MSAGRDSCGPGGGHQGRARARPILLDPWRAFIRFFACEQDLSHDPPDNPLPEAVTAGTEPYRAWPLLAWVAGHQPPVRARCQDSFMVADDRECGTLAADSARQVAATMGQAAMPLSLSGSCRPPVRGQGLLRRILGVIVPNNLNDAKKLSNNRGNARFALGAWRGRGRAGTASATAATNESSGVVGEISLSGIGASGARSPAPLMTPSVWRLPRELCLDFVKSAECWGANASSQIQN
jgi:hypothetical protein